jgi:putative membrane protein
MYQENYRESRNWFRLLLNLQVSIIPAIFPRVLLCSLFALFISWLYFLGIERVSLDIFNSLVPTIVLGLLLVFRTNTAYERFWEGRKLWGMIVNTNRNLARNIWVSITETKPQHREEKIKALRLIVAFAIATKLYLRSEAINAELAELMPSEWFIKLKKMNHPPLEIAFWLADYLQKQYEQKRLTIYQLVSLTKLLDTLVDCLGGCERIVKTPLPQAYSIHLRQLILLYCLSLPFQIVDDLLWFTAPFVALVSFAIFGIEEIGIEIENPFGYEPNDLPLDQICRTMKINMEDLISLEPCTQHWQENENSKHGNF